MALNSVNREKAHSFAKLTFQIILLALLALPAIIQNQESYSNREPKGSLGRVTALKRFQEGKTKEQ
jgi:hypothetical protein